MHARGIELGERVNRGFVEAVGRIRMGHAKMIQHPSDLHKPEQYYSQRLGVWRNSMFWGMRNPIWGYLFLKARQGLFANAIQFGEAGLRETEKVDDGWLSGLIRISLSIVHFYARNYEESMEHSVMANRLLRHAGTRYGEMVTSYWLMSVMIKREKATDFLSNQSYFPNYACDTTISFS